MKNNLTQNQTYSHPPNQTVSDQSNQITAQKVLEMFSSQYTSQLGDRKAEMIIRYCRQRKDGFFYEDIEQISKIVELSIIDLSVNRVGEMVGAILKICEVGSMPFIKLRTSDELKYVPKIPQFLNTFKLQYFKLIKYVRSLLFNPNLERDAIPQEYQQQLRFGVIKFLKSFADEGIADIMKQEASFENKKNGGYEQSPLQKLLQSGTKNLRALNQSSLVEDIIFTMQYYQKNYEFLLPILELISSCILSKQLAQKFSNFGILKDIIYVIFECEDFRSYIVKSCFEIIWNTIEAVGTISIKLFAVEDIITGLKRLFENIMKQGYKLEDKCLRNEIVILVNYLMRDDRALLYFIERQSISNTQSPTTFLDVLLFYATIDEVTFYNEPIRTNQLRAFFGTTSEDLEFKKLVWSGILTAIQSQIPSIIEAIKESPYIITLLLYIDPLANSYAVNRWSAPQRKEIQLHCLTVLANVIIYLKDDFYSKNGLFCLTKFLTNTTDPDHRERCLKAFNNASEFEQSYKLKISDEGVMDNLIEFLQQDSDHPLKIKELCFSIISNLCKDCNKNKKLFRQKGGVDMIVNSLKNPNLGTSARYALYAMSILDCLWNSILGNRKSETSLIDAEGLYVLLEFLETCDDIHKKLTLSCLSFLIENPKAIPYFCDWNSGRTMINATQLLIKIYQNEDTRFGVKYQNGIISNKNRPLNPRTDPNQLNNTDDNINLIEDHSLNNKSQSKEFDDYEQQKYIYFKQKIQRQANINTKNRKMSAKGFNRLKEALQSEDIESDVGTEAYLVRKIKEKVEEYDLRAIVFAILYRTGFDKNELQPAEKQQIEVIQMYPNFKLGEIWMDIKWQLNKENIKPTSDDYHWMLTSIEECEEQVLNCMNTQTLISREYHKTQEQELGKFYNIIRSNKLNK